MLKQQQEEAASRECTFHPVINHRSDRLMAERSEVLRVRSWALFGARNVLWTNCLRCSCSCRFCLLFTLCVSSVPSAVCMQSLITPACQLTAAWGQQAELDYRLVLHFWFMVKAAVSCCWHCAYWWLGMSFVQAWLHICFPFGFIGFKAWHVMAH